MQRCNRERRIAHTKYGKEGWEGETETISKKKQKKGCFGKGGRVREKNSKTIVKRRGRQGGKSKVIGATKPMWHVNPRKPRLGD